MADKPKWTDLFGIDPTYGDTTERAEETRQERAIRNHLDSCIWIDPGRQSGQPCFGGTRIPVDPVMAIVEEAGPEAAKELWPNVTDEHIVAGALRRERYTKRRKRAVKAREIDSKGGEQ